LGKIGKITKKIGENWNFHIVNIDAPGTHPVYRFFLNGKDLICTIFKRSTHY